MGKKAELMPKMNWSEFVTHMAASNQVTHEEADAAGHMVFTEIIRAVSAGKRLVVPGFGAFYLSRHKGHPARFSNERTPIADYVVFRFAASGNLKQKLKKQAKR